MTTSTSDWEAVRTRARTDLNFLCVNLLGYRDAATPIHRDMCAAWQKRSKQQFTLWLAPRGHLKTSLWTIGGNIWRIINNPNIRILLYFNTATNARSKLREFRKHFELNQTFRHYFPEFCPDMRKLKTLGIRWTDSGFEIPCRTRHTAEPTVSVAAVEAASVSAHVDHINWDDGVDDINSRTPELREKIYNGFLDCLQLRHDPGHSTVAVVGTIWHYLDLHSRTRRDELKRRAAGEPPIWRIYHRKIVENGQPIWPERFPERVRTQLRAQLGAFKYSCNYECEPLPEGTSLLSWSKIKDTTDSQLPEASWFVSTSIRSGLPSDPANDAVVLCGLDSDWTLHIRHLFVGTLTPDSLLDHLLFLHRSFGYSRIFIDETYYTEALRSALQRGAHRYRSYPFQLVKRNRTQHLARILSLEPVVNQSRFSVVNDIAHLDLLRAEFDQMSSTGTVGTDQLLGCIAECYALGDRSKPVDIEYPRPNTFGALFGDLRTEGSSPSRVDRYLLGL